MILQSAADRHSVSSATLIASTVRRSRTGGLVPYSSNASLRPPPARPSTVPRRTRVYRYVIGAIRLIAICILASQSRAAAKVRYFNISRSFGNVISLRFVKRLMRGSGKGGKGTRKRTRAPFEGGEKSKGKREASSSRSGVRAA